MSVIQVNTLATAPSTNPLLTAMIGGNLGVPTVPSFTTLTTGIGKIMVPDAAARYFYFLDASNNLWRWDASNPATAPVELLTSAQLGHTILTIAFDFAAGLCLYATTADYLILKIAISAPGGTVAVLAGTVGTAGTTDGTGTAATLSTGYLAIDWLGVNLYTYDTSGRIRRISCTTGVVTTLLSGQGAATNGSVGMGFDKAGNLFTSASQVLAESNPGTFTSGVQLAASTISGQYLAAIACDDYEPSAANVYFWSNTTKLWRYNLAAATLTNIATTASYGPAGAGQMHFRNPALYVADSAGNLLQIQG